ncbi:MAG: cystathionine gamma-synthase family protein [Acidimicrobiia bacterium]|nr:cystathionine gamma-synthase family protein [Acidimicrobiia bacterium]
MSDEHDQSDHHRTHKWPDSIAGTPLHPESLMMGYGYRPEWSEGALKSPIFQTSTFVFESAEEGKKYFELAYGIREPDDGEQMGLIYSRLNNPDLEILEDRLTVWDDAEAALSFRSGMAAISTTMLAFLRPGTVLLISDPIYGGVHYLAEEILPQFGITTVRFDARDSRIAIEQKLAATAKPLGLVHIETPANPTNDLIDIAMCAEIAAAHSTEERRVPLTVDNTFLGPVFSRPLDHGADIVLYSATKFIGGHSDVIAGAALGSAEMLQPVAVHRTIFGTMSSPWSGWLLMRSLETLQLRMTRQAENARKVAEFLREHPKVEAVHYLGFIDADHPQHELYKRQCLGPGSMISFVVTGGEEAAFRVLNNMQLIHLAVSLGSTESLAEHPATMTHADVSDEEKEAVGVTSGLIRVSIGVEHPDDIILDLATALEQA